MYHYFAADGNYGNSAGIVTVLTDNWTEADWVLIDEASDHDRPLIAYRIGQELHRGMDRATD